MALIDEFLLKSGVETAPQRLVSEKESDINRLLRISETKIAEPEVKKEKGGFFRELFREPAEIGKFIGAGAQQKQIEEQQKATTKVIENLIQRKKDGRIDAIQQDRIGKILGSDVFSLPEDFTKTPEQLIGDVLGTALWITPLREIKILKALGPFSRFARGAALGGAFAVAHGMSENVSKEELAKRFAMGAALGGPTEFFAPLIFKGLGKILLGTTKVGVKAVSLTGKAISKVTPEPIRVIEKEIVKFFTPIETRLRTLGRHGVEIADRFLVSDERTLKRGGTGLFNMEEAGLFDLTKQEALTLTDAFEGRLKRANLSPRVRKVFDVLDTQRIQIEQEAREKGIQVQLRGGKKVPFIPRKNFYPHFAYEANKLKKGELREDVLNYAVSSKRFTTKEEAELCLLYTSPSPRD